MRTAVKPSRRKPRSRVNYLRGLLTISLTVAVLIFAKPLLVPLALAVLLAFVLTPGVRWLQRFHLGRVPAVLMVVAIALLLCVLTAWRVGVQISRLADELPAHTSQVREKIQALSKHRPGFLTRVSDAFQRMTEGVTDRVEKVEAGANTVVVENRTSSSMSRLGEVALTILEPVADAALILVLVIFLLIRREDLRNRLIGLLGQARLTGTTRVLVDSAERLSRFLFMQLCVNAAFGLAFGIALWFIGVPYALLWGFLTAVLRFIPYVGSWMAAALPVLVSFIFEPGLFQPMATLITFFVMDLLTANAIEPVLFGHSTGVSPIALLVAAVFWTWVWGPIGLVLSTPLTVCLVVLGQYVSQLKFLSLLLSDQPALPPSVVFYQRLLAGDMDEARSLAVRHVKTEGVRSAPDVVLLPAIRLARRDRETAGLDATDEKFILDSTDAILDQLMPMNSAEGPVRGSVLGCPAHHRTDELAIAMIGHLLAADGIACSGSSTRLLPSDIEAKVTDEHPDVLLISIVPPGGVTQARYLSRRLRKRFPSLRIVIAYLGRVRDFDGLLVRFRAAGADYVTTSVDQTCNQLLSLIPAMQPETSASIPVPVESASGAV
jgi:predicted PurR-regulated permease PerM